MPIPKIAVTAGLMLANMALTMTRKIEGPRLDDTAFTGGDYGASLHNVWGMRRIQPPIFWAEDLREVKRKRKTKGGKYNEYTYYGTWAVALAGHEIEGIRRIWFDTHLALDLSGAGPVTPFSFGGPTTSFGETGVDNAGQKFVNSHIAVYTGTETQEPDPRIEAWCVDRYGEGYCPAYRGTAYIVFKDIPLEKLGNRIPQVSVEVLGKSDASYPFTAVSGTSRVKSFSEDYSLMIAANSTGVKLFDVATLQLLTEFDYDVNVDSGTGHFAFTRDGKVLSTDEFGAGQWSKSVETGAEEGISGVNLSQSSSYVTYDKYGQEWTVWEGTNLLLNGSDALDVEDLIGATGSVQAMFADVDGEVWIVIRRLSDGTVFFYCASTPQALETDLVIPGAQLRAFHFADSTNDHFVVGVALQKLYTIDRATGLVIDEATPALTSAMTEEAFAAIMPGAATFFIGFEEFSSTDLSQIRLLDYTDWVGGSTTNTLTVYDPINHALITNAGWAFLDRVSSNGVTLGSICADVAARVGIEDYDFTDLTQLITGWSATRGPGEDMIAPLLDVYDSDIRPHDFEIEGVTRTGVATGATLLTESFVGEPRYGITIKQAAELPAALLADFADTAADQQPNNVRAARPLDATGARGESKLDLTTLALDVDTAAQLMNRHFRRIWNERKEISNGMTAQELGLEPADVRMLSLDGQQITARCVKVTIRADESIATEWKYDAITLATLDGSIGASFDGRNESTIAAAQISKGFVLDIPYLTDSDAQTTPIVYGLAGPYADGSWPGAIIYQSVDGEYSEELIGVPSSSEAVWGFVDEAMPYANPNLWDRGTEITVNLSAGELTGCTEAAANADPTLNMAAIGVNGRWEIVQFTNATLVSGRTYTVSGFKRGRRGTEWAAESHAAYDAFVLLDTAISERMGLSEVGTDLSFKAVTSGRTEAGTFAIDVEPYSGASLKPYAPVHLEAVKESNGDWTLTWVRRTRVGGAWTSGTSIPLSEDSEAYQVVVGDGVSSATKSVTGAQTYTWTVADQTTDTGGEVTDLVWTVAQVSDAVGAGFVAEG